MSISVVAGCDVIKTDATKVIELLQDTIQRVERGELNPNRALLVLVDSDVSTFKMTTLYHGRATEMIGFLSLAEDSLKEGIYN